MKYESGGRIMKEFAAISAKACIFLTDNSNKGKKVKETKSFVIKKTLNLRIINTVQQQFNLKIK